MAICVLLLDDDGLACPAPCQTFGFERSVDAAVAPAPAPRSAAQGAEILPSPGSLTARLTGCSDWGPAAGARACRFRGVLLTSSDDERLFELIVGVTEAGTRHPASGEIPTAHGLAAGAPGGPVVRGTAAQEVDVPPTSGAGRLASLTPHERDILIGIADGLSNREIGQRLGLAEKTVKNRVTGLLAKLGLRRRTQAAVFAARLGAGPSVHPLAPRDQVLASGRYG